MEGEIDQARHKYDEVLWVVLGPGGDQFATCTRCGRAEPPPELPCSLEALIAYLEYLAARHARCLPTTTEEEHHG